MTTTAIVSAVCASGAVWCRFSALRARVQRPEPPPPGVLVLLTGAPATLAVAIVMTPALALLGVGSAAVVATTALRWRRNRQRARRQARAGQVTELILVLAASLRAGLPAPAALGHAAEDEPVVRSAATAAQRAADVPRALRAARRGPGDDGLERLAIAWQVADRTGAPLAGVLDRLSEVERQERDLRREVAAGIAPARATAALMALLPVFGLLIGSGFGGDPLWVVITAHPVVAFSVAVGAGLACAGVLWIDRIADGAETS
ncbi:type II secretion system F family protein [Aeromicrobium sp. YIM 150415]|uniref:type II secretion system F family protein n=1 Tax=Aeromicrobium sp. YIM 150415 TaxID=2803912 RepID=UPI001963E80E|nr:type II secretion system F family protein [Aeromicrobium sp. YIM 150415]MBM9464115.1 type II secretion system F family protein [Aeromicrobium sp. YIM 150415]